jgi:hypothetical protein
LNKDSIGLIAPSSSIVRRRVGFRVDQDPRIAEALSRCTPAQRDFFRQVLEILAESPYRFRDLIHRNVWADGRAFYQYYDGIIPLVFLYRVYPREEDFDESVRGYVYIFDAVVAWW